VGIPPSAPPAPGAAARVGAVIGGVLDLVMDSLLGVGHSLQKAAKNVVNLRIGSAMINLASIPFNALAMVAVRVVHLYRLTFHDIGLPRPLTAEEQATLRKVFGPSLRLGAIRIVEDGGLLTASAQAITLGNVIRVKQGQTLTPELLVHEATHCWQHQNGGDDYLLRALGAQLFSRGGYDFDKGIEQGLPWNQLNPEQQADLLYVAQKSRYFDLDGQSLMIHPTNDENASVTERNADPGSRDRTGYLRAALKELRAGRGTETPGD
jgi:hypothetical protein